MERQCCARRVGAGEAEYSKHNEQAVSRSRKNAATEFARRPKHPNAKMRSLQQKHCDQSCKTVYRETSSSENKQSCGDLHFLVEVEAGPQEDSDGGAVQTHFQQNSGRAIFTRSGENVLVRNAHGD